MDHCDALDRIKDGLITDPSDCKVDPKWVLCSVSATDQSKCLTSEEWAAANKLYTGATDAEGHHFLPGGWQPGSEFQWGGGMTGGGPPPQRAGSGAPLSELRNHAVAMAREVAWWHQWLLSSFPSPPPPQTVGITLRRRVEYVRTVERRSGIGAKLLTHLQTLTKRPVLIGTWADATWAIRFYEKHGNRPVPANQKDKLLESYWNVPSRQIETSIVLFRGELPDEIP